MKLKSELDIDTKTHLHCEDESNYGTKHHFRVISDDEKTLCEINYQEGPVKEQGVNGVQDDHLLLIVRERLLYLNKSKWANRESAMALTKVEEAIMWLNKRTANRTMLKKEGTSLI
jgi:hypothetical protein